MKNNEELQRKLQDATIRPLSNAIETKVSSKVGGRIKRIIYLASLSGIGLFVNSCIAGYVGTEPVYVEYARPERPGALHVWIDGDWGWNSQSHIYVQKAGYWEKPRQGQVFVTGHWQTTPRGRSWSNGYWQRQDHQERPQRQGRQERPNR
jgi:hypothetical protein